MKVQVIKSGNTSPLIRIPMWYSEEHGIVVHDVIDLREDEEGRLILTPKDVEENLSTMHQLMEVRKFIAESKLLVKEEKP